MSLSKKIVLGCIFISIIFLTSSSLLVWFAYKEIRHHYSEFVKEQLVAEQTKIKAVNQRRANFEAFLGKDVKSAIPDEFYTYSGFRDWWRAPLVYPYQILSCDTINNASICKYDIRYSVDNPNESSSQIIDWVEKLATDNRMLLFKCSHDGVVSYGILHYSDARIERFKSENKMVNYAMSHGYSGPDILYPVEKYYDQYYDFSHSFCMDEVAKAKKRE